MLPSYVYLLYHVCIAVLNLDAGLLARSQYPKGPATGHLDTGFSCFPCVYKRMLRWFPIFQVASTCFSCSPPDLNFLVTYFIFVYMWNNHCHRVITQLQLIIIITIIIIIIIIIIITCTDPPPPKKIVTIFCLLSRRKKCVQVASWFDRWRTSWL
jgi:hypothetical protein